MHKLMLIAIIAAILPVTAEAGVRNFFSPEMQGARVDACLSGGACGKPAADAFCKAEGYDKAVLFQRERFNATRIVDSGQLCAGDSCTAFRQVKCFSIKNDLAAN